MSIELITALCTGLVSIIAALGAMITSIRNGQKFQTDAEAKDRKLQDIHVLVNGRLSDAMQDIKQLRAYVSQITGVPAPAKSVIEAAVVTEEHRHNAAKELLRQADSSLAIPPQTPLRRIE